MGAIVTGPFEKGSDFRSVDRFRCQRWTDQTVAVRTGWSRFPGPGDLEEVSRFDIGVAGVAVDGFCCHAG